jgi:cell division protein FtsI/penicillin-binding protein 2
MDYPLQNRRLLFVTFLTILAFCGLAYRLVDLQAFQHEDLRKKAQANTIRTFFWEPRRGDVRDIKGNLMATSRQVKTICVDPTLICNTNVGNHQEEVARALAPLLGLQESDLLKQLQIQYLTNQSGQLVPDRYVILKRKVKVEDWEKVRDRINDLSFGTDEKTVPKRLRPYYRALRQRSVFAEDAQLREYPNGRQAAHVIGYVGVEERKANKGWVIETSGKDGLELTLNGSLTGVRGWRVTEQNEHKQELVVYREQDVNPRPGLTVVSTLDLGLQNIIETALEEGMQKYSPISASAIAVRPRTGEIAALAVLPNYDPNDPSKYDPDWRRNRVITDLNEPGSTFKVVAVTGALNEHVVNPGTVFDCENGKFFYAGRLLHDTHPYGELTVEQVITKSSNIGAAKIALLLGQERFRSYITNFGFGYQTGLPLPGERQGTVHPLASWNKLSITRVAMGQEVAVTPLQMAMMMSAIANGGRLMRPMLVNRLEDEEGRVVAQYQPQAIRTVCTPATARMMIEALKTVVTTNGTARKARLANYTAAGKTGTAQKSAGKEGYSGQHFSSFIGFFPADNAELCIAIFLDNPHPIYFGGETAAPIFKAIAERAGNYLNIKPEFIAVESLENSPHASAREAAMVATD